MQNEQLDVDLWTRSLSSDFLPPPRPWKFTKTFVQCGADIFPITECALYELALLDIHASSWHGSGKSFNHLRRYHNLLKFEVEHQFSALNNQISYSTPGLLKPWLCRIFALRKHDDEGRKQMRDVRRMVGPDSLLIEGNFTTKGNKMV
jgi:hypothetical protein